MKHISLLSLATLLIVTSWPVAWGAETKHDFAKWEKDISAYEQMDRTNPPPRGALLFAGSSSIRLWKTLAQDFPEHRVINRGFGGSQIVDSTHFADRIIFPYAPRMIIFRAGGNDLWAGKSAEQVFAEYKEFVSTVHAKLPETDIAFISWNPTLARLKQAQKEKALNNMVAEFSRGNAHLKYIECYDMVLGADEQPRAELFVTDKLHFSAAGYKLLAERVRPFLPK